jgi:hypothetical protein
MFQVRLLMIDSGLLGVAEYMHARNTLGKLTPRISLNLPKWSIVRI